MSILNAASAESVNRGFCYCEQKRVLSWEQIDEDCYKGEVKGSGNNIYQTIINVKHPRSSLCNCPHAEGNGIVCKHKVALYFTIFEDEFDDYKEYLNSDIDFDFNDEDENEYYGRKYRYYRYDDYYDYNERKYSNDDDYLPSSYDEILDSYINKMSIDELRKIYKDELNRNKTYTFKYLLKNEYREYIRKNGDDVLFVDKLAAGFKDYLEIYDYDYNDFFKKILSNNEKKKIKSIIEKDDNKSLIDCLLNDGLAMYKEYDWVAKLLKKHLSVKEIYEFNKKLDNRLAFLKSYRIKNSLPKSFLLINQYLLNDYSVNELAKSLIKNAKYYDYVKYVVNNYPKYNLLYEEIKKQIDTKKCSFYQSEIPNIFLQLEDRLSYMGNKPFLDFCYYDFLFNANIKSLEYIIYFKDEEHFNLIKEKAKSKRLLEPFYAQTKQYDKLYELLKDENKEYLFIRYLKFLEVDYHDEIYNYFYSKFDEILENGTGRETYQKAVKYLTYIKKLDDGEKMIKNIVNKLKLSKHEKKRALFEEISKINK